MTLNTHIKVAGLCIGAAVLLSNCSTTPDYAASKQDPLGKDPSEGATHKVIKTRPYFHRVERSSEASKAGDSSTRKVLRTRPYFHHVER